MALLLAVSPTGTNAQGAGDAKLMEAARALQSAPRPTLPLLSNLISLVDEAIDLGISNEDSAIMILNRVGMGYGALGDIDSSAAAFERLALLVKDPEMLAQVYYNVGYTFMQANRPSDAVVHFEKSLKHKPDFVPSILKAAYIYNSLGDLPRVAMLLQRAIAAEPDNASAHVYLGDTLNNLKRWNEAVDVYKTAVTLFDKATPSAEMKQGKAKALVHLADTLMNLKKPSEAYLQYEKSLKLDPANKEAVVAMLRMTQELATWKDQDQLIERVSWLTRGEVAAGQPTTISPYLSLFLPITPQLRREIAESRAQQFLKEALPMRKRDPKDLSGYPHFAGIIGKANAVAPDDDSNGDGDEEEEEEEEDDEEAEEGETKGDDERVLNIGYLSRRFEEYAGTQLMLRIFGSHDRTKVRVFGFANGPDDGSEERKTVSETCDEFFDVSLMTAAQTAELIASKTIDILVDYDSAHDANSLSVLALRPAPIQAAWLGFAGTSGADYIDYLIADSHLIPKVETTFAILKPDTSKSPEKVAAVLARLAEEGFAVVKHLRTQLTRAQAEELYVEHAERSFYSEVVEFMTEGEITALLLHKTDAVADLRSLMGPTKPEEAKLHPTTIRAQYATDVMRNAIHGSEHAGAVLREASVVFGESVSALAELASTSHVDVKDPARDYYTERIVRLPITYQPHDDQQEVVTTLPDSEKEMTRADFGLPEDGFVFVCFNRINKIDKEAFASWMEILKRVERSVLWLFNSDPIAVMNLQLTAEAAGVDPKRLVFAEKLPKSAHIGRHTLADLFLDTFYYDAHTTAADALWAGLPILTRPGDVFSSRVASSLLHPLGLGELVVLDTSEYIEKAVELAQTPPDVKRLRETLRDTRESSEVFNPRATAAALEAAFHKMVECYAAGVVSQEKVSFQSRFCDISVPLNAVVRKSKKSSSM